MPHNALQPLAEAPQVLPHNQASARTWGAGGAAYDEISRHIADAIEHAVDRLVPGADEQILDVATGTGWAARRIAARGSIVTGVDIGEQVIATARELSSGRRTRFEVADAEALPFPDHSFDAVISTFGVMFCRHPEKAASELARVCRPGGRLVLSTWVPGGRVHEMFDLIRRYSPPQPAETPSPFAWGDTNRLVELLGNQFDLGFEEGVSLYRETDGAAAFRKFSVGFGPVVTLLEGLPEETAASFRHEFEMFHERHRTGAGVLVPREYLITVGRQQD
jgi:SAM-dependent methyltransferase